MRKLDLALVSAVTLAIFSAHGAHAAVITPVSASASTYYNAVAQHPSVLINGSGLSVNDISGTHSANFNADNMWHAGAGQGIGGSAPITADQWVQFDLGSVQDIYQAYIWQFAQTDNINRGVQQFDVLVGTSAGGPFTSVLDDATLAIATNGQPTAAQLFEFEAPGVRYIRLRIDSAWSNATNEYVGLSEVRFGDVAPVVPEPTSLGLLGLAGMALLARRRR